MNKVILIGNLGQDAEPKYSNNGACILPLNVATNKTWFNKESQQRETLTEWHKVVVFGKRAEGLVKCNLSKGDRVGVEGELRTRQYQDRDGNQRYSTEVVASEVELLGGGKPQRRSQPEPAADPFGGDQLPF